MYVYIYIHVHSSIYIYICIYVYIHTPIHTYVYICVDRTSVINCAHACGLCPDPHFHESLGIQKCNGWFSPKKK